MSAREGAFPSLAICVILCVYAYPCRSYNVLRGKYIQKGYLAHERWKTTPFGREMLCPDNFLRDPTASLYPRAGSPMDLISPFLDDFSRDPSGSLVSLSEGSDGGAPTGLQHAGVNGAISAHATHHGLEQTQQPHVEQNLQTQHHQQQKQGAMSRTVYHTRSTVQPSQQVHPNLFVRGIPLHWTEEQMVELFSQFGELSSLRLVKHSVRKTSLGYGFVRYHLAQDASAAINTLHGKMLDGQALQVKLADSDAGPPSTSSVSGLSPCDTLYVKHVPLSFSKRDLERLFAQYGKVVDVKEFPCLDQFRGSSALVKMESVASAALAIKHVHGLKPHGWLHNIIVRFAESEKEKKERLARKESQKKFVNELSKDSSGELGSMSTFVTSPCVPNAVHTAHTAKMADSASASQTTSSSDAMYMNKLVGQLSSLSQPQHLLQADQLPRQQALVIVSNIPPKADRLWVYEHFSRFGGIQSLLLDECLGVAHIHFSEVAAGMRAMLEMNHHKGMLVNMG